MIFRELGIKGSFEISLNSFSDERGFFSELFKSSIFFNNTGRSFTPEQVNLSQSKKGALRGIHFADVPRGQAKYVQVLSGSIRDYIVDLRLGSETFGTWEAVTLLSPATNALFLPEGVGHAFLSLEDDTLVAYLVSTEYNPLSEHAINPEDAELSLDFRNFVDEVFISDKDKNAFDLSHFVMNDQLPKLIDCDAFIARTNMKLENE